MSGVGQVVQVGTGSWDGGVCQVGTGWDSGDRGMSGGD